MMGLAMTLGLILNVVGVERASMEAGSQAMKVRCARISSLVRVTESAEKSRLRIGHEERSCEGGPRFVMEEQGRDRAIQLVGFRKPYDSGKMRNMFKSTFSCACGLALQNKEDAHHVQHAHVFLRCDDLKLNCQTGRVSGGLILEMLENKGF